MEILISTLMEINLKQKMVAQVTSLQTALTSMKISSNRIMSLKTGTKMKPSVQMKTGLMNLKVTTRVIKTKRVSVKARVPVSTLTAQSTSVTGKLAKDMVKVPSLSMTALVLKVCGKKIRKLEMVNFTLATVT